MTMAPVSSMAVFDCIENTPPVEQRPALDSPETAEKLDNVRRHTSKSLVSFDDSLKGEDEYDGATSRRLSFGRDNSGQLPRADSTMSSCTASSVTSSAMRNVISDSQFGPRPVRRSTSFTLGSTPPLARRRVLECPESPHKGEGDEGIDEYESGEYMRHPTRSDSMSSASFVGRSLSFRSTAGGAPPLDRSVSTYSNSSVASSGVMPKVISDSQFGARPVRRSTSVPPGSTPPLARRRVLECPDSPHKDEGDDVFEEELRHFASTESMTSAHVPRELSFRSVNTTTLDLHTPAVPARSSTPDSAPWAPEAVRMKQPAASPDGHSVESVVSTESSLSIKSAVLVRELFNSKSSSGNSSAGVSSSSLGGSSASPTQKTSWFSQLADKLRRLY
eukprot:TRINITY_DN19347_c0_g1_i1.p1 TRINITY_DN19347_c0_g1~~TRINITY_DN19347_c0_g1_i1.p1  ORF type:complete len:390 (-),score=52.37 TRINITY_DN19347_c0_g1_i1:178-1347(-)